MPCDSGSEAVREILRKYGYERTRFTELPGPLIAGAKTMLEFWQGARGGIVMIYASDIDRVRVFAEWATGNGLEDLDAMLDSRFPAVTVRVERGIADVSKNPQGIYMTIQDNDTLEDPHSMDCSACGQIADVLFGGKCQRCAEQPLFRANP